MKLLKKLRFLFSLTALLTCLCMGSAVVNADDLYDYYGYGQEEPTTLSAEDAKTYANGKINMATIKSIVKQYVSAATDLATYSPEELDFASDAMSYQTDIYSKFAAVVSDESCGAFTSYDNMVVKELDGENAVDVEVDLHFEKKELKMILHVSCFDTIGPQVTSTEFTLADQGEESLGSKMADAGANTLMGMGVVFFVLIFMSIIISCFGFIPKITEKFANRRAGKVETDSAELSLTPDVAVAPMAEEDNSELIAVIAAAIAASEQTSTDSFVVRSIRRR